MARANPHNFNPARRSGSKNSMSIGFDVSGLDQLAAGLASLKPSTQMRIVADALGKAARPIVSAAKARVPKDTGALRRSLGAVVRRYPEKGAAMAVIGAQRGYFKNGKHVKPGERKKGEKYDAPANYSHLVEFGSFRAKPKPFLRPAVESNRERADAIIGEGFGRAVEAENKRAMRRASKT